MTAVTQFGTMPPVVEREALRQLQRDIEVLSRLPKTWEGLDPTAIAEGVVDVLLGMLAADFVGLRFRDTNHVFLRTAAGLDQTVSPEDVRAGLGAWFAAGAVDGALELGGSPMSVASCPLGESAGMGMIVAGARRGAFPDQVELAKLRLAGSQAALACREVRELSDRQPPPDSRTKPLSDAELAENEWRLHLAINSIPTMAWSCTPDGMVDFCNQGYADNVGWPSEQFLGQGFWPMFHPDDIPHMVAAWQDLLATKRGRDVEGRIRGADGQYRWFLMRQKPLFDAGGGVLKWYGACIDIEDRKRAEAALEQARNALAASEQNLDLIINSLPALIWSARPDGSADFVNKSLCDYAGLPPEDILEWRFLDLYHPEDLPGVLRTWTHDLAHSNRTAHKARMRGANGQYRWFFLAGSKLTDANGVVRWVGCNVDIDDLTMAEDALRNTEHFQQIISSVPGLTWASDAQGGTTFWSQQYLDYAGARMEDVVGVGFVDYIHPDDREPFMAVWAEAIKSGWPGEGEVRLRRADGVYRWFLWRVSPFFDKAGEITQWFGVNVDIENRKRAEEDLRQSQANLAHASRVTTMGELAVSIAHEVNQPLMAVVTNAGACLRWLSDSQTDIAQAREAAERIVRDGHRAGEIITGLRNLARKAAPREDDIRLDEVARLVLDLMRGELARHNIVANIRLDDRGLTVRGDSVQLQQVVLNLIMNAVDAMASSPGPSHVLTVVSQIRDADVLVSVTDTGPGVGAGDPDRVFEAFFTTKAEGIGMGLPICRSIIEAHGGKIWAANSAAHGSVFSFTLPLGHG